MICMIRRSPLNIIEAYRISEFTLDSILFRSDKSGESPFLLSRNFYNASSFCDQMDIRK